MSERAIQSTVDGDRRVDPDPVELLRRLIRFRSVNPPGGEGPCLRFVADLLRDAGLPVQLVARDADRPNVVALLPGRGAAPPLLLHAHADVVPTQGQAWTYPPFEARVIDGHVWGRGAIDMKGGLAMMVSALLRLVADGVAPAGDILLAVSPDEETGSAVGAKYLVDTCPDLFAGVRYAIGEDGGAGIDAPRRVHPIVVAEKRACWLRARLHGPGGHGSRQGRRGTAVEQLTRLLVAVHSGRLPGHRTPAVDRMLDALCGAFDEPVVGALRVLREGGPVPYDLLPEPDAVYLDSVVRNTVNVTVVRAGEQVNVIPSTVTVELDGRILPGSQTVADYLAELTALIGFDPGFEVLVEGEPMAEPEFGPFFDTLVAVLREADPPGVPVPMLTPASTDARLFAGLGIHCYGWLPMLLPSGVRYRDTMHAADERIPVAALRFGAECMHQLLLRYR